MNAIVDPVFHPFGVSAADLARQILGLVFKLRRIHPEDLAATEDLDAEMAPHLPKIQDAVTRHQPLQMILPAFPGKSPNRNKTLGAMPDLAERHAMDNLHQLCRDIQSIYPPGAQVAICSDGYCFSDVVYIPDAEVAAYMDELIRYARQRHGDSFRFYDLKDHFSYIGDLDSQREELLILYSDSIEQIKRQCQDEPAMRAMYQGITRFLFEDAQGMERFAGHSKTSLQKMARANAYRVIQRSNAWSRLLERAFPDSLRLSIHPQFRVSSKIGVRLVDSVDAWLTPWHAAAIKHEHGVMLKKRSDIDENQSALVFVDGRPSHFIATAA
ncbi:L-tyrosine/L-tryptophan isonitrile synthase family protein [Chromobacterium haemolyticum]|uniref:L-tyrosine/L-tryptophan isonitrile synthase family protein n=1 Tax=Chromobacterium TaxID=535 RepID=UPI0040565D8C